MTWIMLPVGLVLVLGIVVAVLFYFSGGKGHEDDR